MALKSQSAMEYLMTYGWAVLAIAVVVIALFQLGIFNSANLASHSTAGACQVVRNSAETSLAGQCNNGLPKYVPEFGGVSSTIDVPSASQLNFVSGSFTVLAWVKPSAGLSSYYGLVDKKTSYNGNYAGWQLWLDYRSCPSSGPIELRINDGSMTDDATPLGNGQCSLLGSNSWVYVAIVVNLKSSVTFYVNGAYDGTSSISFNSVSNNAELDIGGTTGYFFPGLISNVQVYNASLSSNSIESLYQEGIGGAPIQLQNLVGWWPLNGNAQDYSGENNNGQILNVVYNSTWSLGYVQP